MGNEHEDQDMKSNSYRILMKRIRKLWPGSGVVVGVTNSKGGSGKSTVCIHLGGAAEDAAVRTLIIDTDSQRSCLDWDVNRDRAGPGPRVVSARDGRNVARAVAWGRDQGFDLIIIDTAGRDAVTLPSIMSVCDIVLMPAQPNLMDLNATLPVRRMAGKLDILAPVILTRVLHEDTARTRKYVGRYSASGKVLSRGTTAKVAYTDAYEAGLTVQEFDPAGQTALEMARILHAVLKLILENREEGKSDAP